MMERTKKELNEELLRVYRFLFATVAERDRFRTANGNLRQKVVDAEACTAAAEEQLKTIRVVYNHCEDQCARLIDENFFQARALDATLDLVGAVVEDDAQRDIMIHELAYYFRTGENPPRPTVKCFCAATHDGECQPFRVSPPNAQPGCNCAAVHEGPCQSASIVKIAQMRTDGLPLRCISCDGEKEEDFAYFCERCFELDNLHDLGLFSEAMTDWDNGHRDFPRNGKNAKVLADGK